MANVTEAGLVSKGRNFAQRRADELTSETRATMIDDDESIKWKARWSLGIQLNGHVLRE